MEMRMYEDGTKVEFKDGWDGKIYTGIYTRNPATGEWGVLYGDKEFCPQRCCDWIEKVGDD